MIALDRNLHSRGGIKATWRLIKADGVFTAKVCCPICGYQANLAETHEIDNAGLVDPSIDCPDCDFHDHVRLNGWQPVIQGPWK